MEPTRRFWVIAALAISGAVLAPLFQNVLWLGIPLGIGTWVLVDQLVFTQALSRLTDTPSVTQTVARETVLVDSTTTLTLQITDPRNGLASLTAHLSLPTVPALTLDGPHEYELTDTTDQLTVPVRVAIAGTYELPAPTVHLTSHRGLFRESLSLGTPCSITGEPRVPRNIHIGTGGEQIAVADGEHDADQGSAGFEPGKLREYLPVDPTSRIDWKATARLGDPYVRDFDAKTTRQTHLIVDRREPMQDGIAGQTKLDYAREISIWLNEYVANLDDPLTATLIDDAGATTPAKSNTQTTQYQHLRHILQDLRATPSQTDTSQPDRANHRQYAGTDAQRRRTQLTGDDRFTQLLRPYYQNVEAYLQRVTDDPLFESVQNRLAASSDDAWIVIITDDTNRRELLETARTAASPTTAVSVFIVPTVLFDTTGLTELTQSYQDYRDFEEFRQQLTTITNVTAFEVGPSDRLAALLETEHPQQAKQ
ncbi:DUF58 domain-containing protein [Halobacterium salinarum]|uniref:DUF58 domain-containing protein n=1 Tax=Halobacterium salinarum TaxID=2242 RepID=UPI002552FDC2|nr:DUF58 domain-containing protein [Halobacterium salinarum]MDL0138001.1 DUF58 domain-containing protein [Halobacterium salinarum]